MTFRVFFIFPSGAPESELSSHLRQNKKPPQKAGAFKLCGERGIRTPGPVARTTVFKTAAIDHSAISP
jgi:hypothetical protein